MSCRFLLLLGIAIGLGEPLASAAEEVRGHLVAVGGGKTDPAIVARALTLAGGAASPVAILPQASAQPDAGAKSAAMWRDIGATQVSVVDLAAGDAARRTLRGARVIWFPGGDQNKLMAALHGTGLEDVIRARYRDGAVVGGTSAGAAVLSGIMLTGKADLQSLTPAATTTAPGLGVWPAVIVDQHFLARQRFNRLLSAVLDHPEKIGVGIDEGTAVVVSAGRWEVLGASCVTILDARHAMLADRPTKAPHAASDVRLHVLRAGQSWQPDSTP